MTVDGTIRLWGAGTARPMRVAWMLEEYGLTYEHRPIASRSGETYTEAYLALNPKHKIPTLEHGDLVVTESGAIVSYIADAFDAPDGFYVPRNARERAHQTEWISFILMELDALGIYVIRRHGDLGDLYGHAENVVQAAREYILDGLNGAQKMWPEEQDYLMAGGFGIPDILLTTTVDFMLAKGMELPDRVTAHYHRCAARPAYQRAHEICFPK